MTEFGTLWILVMFGIPTLISLIDAIEEIRRRADSHYAPTEPTWSAGFSMRRSDSALRERYPKVRPHGRLTEINECKDDPHDP